MPAAGFRSTGLPRRCSGKGWIPSSRRDRRRRGRRSRRTASPSIARRAGGVLRLRSKTSTGRGTLPSYSRAVGPARWLPVARSASTGCSGEGPARCRLHGSRNAGSRAGRPRSSRCPRLRPIGDVVEVQEPAFGRRIRPVAGVVQAYEADAARLEPGQTEKGDQVVVHRRLADDLVVRGQSLRADEPIVLDPVQIAGAEAADVILRPQRRTRAEEVVVVVLDHAADGKHVQPMVVGVEGGARERHRGRRVGRGVLRADPEDRHLRLRIEFADIAGEPAERCAKLRAVRKRRQQQPRRRRFAWFLRRGLRLFRRNLRRFVLRVRHVRAEAADGEERKAQAPAGSRFPGGSAIGVYGYLLVGHGSALSEARPDAPDFSVRQSLRPYQTIRGERPDLYSDRSGPSPSR